MLVSLIPSTQGSQILIDALKQTQKHYKRQYQLVQYYLNAYGLDSLHPISQTQQDTNLLYTALSKERPSTQADAWMEKLRGGKEVDR